MRAGLVRPGWLAKALVCATVTALIVAFLALDLGRFLTLAQVRDAQQALLALHAQRPVMVVGGFFLIYVAVTALSVPGAVPLTLAAGAIFGLGWGTLIVSFASTAGAVLAMWAARHLLRDAVRARLGTRLAEIDRGLQRDGALYLFTLRLLPVVPFFVINLAMGLTAMRTWTFAWVSQLGMLAGTAVYVNAGTQLAQLQSLKDALSPGLLAAFALLGLFPWGVRAGLSVWQARRALAPWAQRRPRRFDRNLIVIGAGAAGLVSSYVAAAAKASVTLVEAHRMGGDCLNTGCVPSKALIRAASAAHAVREAAAFGIEAPPPRVDFERVMQRVREVVREIEPRDSMQRYASLGVDVRQGRAHILDPWHVRITDAQGQSQTLSARAIVVATGARPIVPPLPGLLEAGVLTSDTLWDLRELPPRLLVLGGGPVGCELAQAFARLGSQVTLVELAPRLLGREDEEVSAFVAARLRADGVEVLTGHRALRCERLRADAGSGSAAPDPAWRLIAEGAGVERPLAFDRIVCAVGRQARLEGLGLEALGLWDPARPQATLAVDEHLRTRIPTLLACGDVVGPLQFTHTASQQAWTAAVNGLLGRFGRFKADLRVVPRCTFVDPPVARVGLNRGEAAALGLKVACTRFDLAELDRAAIDSAAPEAGPTVATDAGDRAPPRGWVQVLTAPGSDRILGATLVGPQADALIAGFALAMRSGIGLKRILGTIHAYPTMSEAARSVAAQWRRDHTPQALLRWLQRWHAWRLG